ncbi:MAG: hypothetical protein A2138_17075 [Deltaproteobacteria bacterium RBG_16_71_12]|nr:MAG: hypothetical protein A2138_17075 [Deltaproteobacteria bacterium RBG_16_71_12]
MPTTIALDEHPQLQRIAWQLAPGTTLTPREAHALYQRNWRHVDVAALDAGERLLIGALVRTFGGDLGV